jgi:hypothetical protein
MVLLDELERDVQRLSLTDQVLLLERLARHIRDQLAPQQNIESELEAMAADPDIQRELRAIEDEFGPV